MRPTDRTAVLRRRAPFAARWPRAVLALVVMGCVGAASAQQLAESAATPDANELLAERAFAAWRNGLAGHIAQAGQGDPGVLSQLPALRTPATARPAQIVFAVNDIDALSPGRDGCDVVGLLLGKLPSAPGSAYVFVIGAVQRSDHRPTTILDVRVATMTVRDGTLLWETGVSDAKALALYRRHLDADTALRFPGVRDRFSFARCERGVCVEELGSGARWSLD